MTSPDPTPRRLRRSATDQKVAGVAGGLADHFGLDPTLVRIAFGVMSLIGGIGLAAYAVGAFVMPAADGAPPLTGTAKTALVLIAIAAVLSVPFTGAGAVLLLVPLAMGVLIWHAFGGKADPRLVRASVIIVAITGAVLAGAVAAVVTAFGGGVVIAGLVIVAGLALIAAGARGGGRWLIVPALLLAIPTAVVSAADLRLEGGVGNQAYHPGSVSELRPMYRIGAGRLRLDLRDVTFERSQQVDLAVRVGVGELRVLVPNGVCVQTTAHAGLGDVHVFGRVNQGVDVDAERSGIPAAGQPVLRLDLHGGAAALFVKGPLGHPHGDACEG